MRKSEKSVFNIIMKLNFEQAIHFTHRRIFPGDMALNYALAAIMLAVPGFVDSTLGSAPMLSDLVYRIIGIGFLGFAIWQTLIVRKAKLSTAALYFAAILAFGPVIALTIALLMDFALKPFWRYVLWVGNVYMLLLTVWYIYVARWIVKHDQELI
jgi:uncharacterized membrane protein YuzA (DUF378 family)